MGALESSSAALARVGEYLPAHVETVDQALIAVERAYLALGDALDYQENRKVQDVAVMAAALAREAKDQRLLARATELRTRAQRKAGAMLLESAAKGERHDGHGDQKSESRDTTPKPTLAQIGITKDQSAQWQKLARASPEEFEDALDTTKAVTADISTAKVLKVMRGEGKRPGPTYVAPDVIEELPPLVPRPRSPEEQGELLLKILEEAEHLTNSAAQLRDAIQPYRWFRVSERLPHLASLLTELEKLQWTNSNRA